jgi:FtsH-binding integral membrane protein
MDSKAWYESKSVWGGIVSVLAGVAALVGHALSPQTQAALTDNGVAIATAVATIVGSALAIYGRLKADKVIK